MTTFFAAGAVAAAVMTGSTACADQYADEVAKEESRLQDAGIQPEWNESLLAQDQTSTGSASVTPMSAARPSGRPTSVDQIESHPERYLGRTVTVSGRVDEIHGPHLFEMAGPGEGRPDPDVVVFLAEDALAAVRDNDSVTVTGVIRRFARPELISESRWFDIKSIMNQDLDRLPVLVATSIVSRDRDQVVVLGAEDGNAASGASAAPPPIADVGAVAAGGLSMVGRRVALPALAIQTVDRNGGFLVKGDAASLFVLADDPGFRQKLRPGEFVTISGVVLALPDNLAGLQILKEADAVVYLYADQMISRRD